MSEVPTIDTPRLRLRAFRPDDAPDLAQLLNDAEVVRHLRVVPFPYTLAHADEFIRSTAGKGPLTVGSCWAIELKEAAELCGCVGLRPDGHDARVMEIGCWVARARWRQGIAGAAVPKAVDYALAVLGSDRVSAVVAAANPGSRRVLEKAGLHPVGSVEAFLVARDQVLTKIMYTLSRGEWLTRRSKPIVPVVAVVLIDADDRVLLAQRPAGKVMAGLWEFPGGKIEAGETPETALIRELREELGVDTEASCLAPLTFASHSYPDFHLFMPLFVCRVWKGRPTAKEHQALKWVPIPRLSDYPMPPADLPLVAMIRDIL
ncbi:MAG: GNAT family N-acetyltransferase [Alphaproteobacteria bacterium]|nr:GNAT family N-acetyltransferase [Alphaproteobacteria bacterium]